MAVCVISTIYNMSGRVVCKSGGFCITYTTSFMALIPFVFSSWIINDITYLFTPGLIIYSSRSQLLESQIP